MMPALSKAESYNRAMDILVHQSLSPAVSQAHPMGWKPTQRDLALASRLRRRAKKRRTAAARRNAAATARAYGLIA